MMATRSQTEELAIHHVREPGEWMPVGGFKTGQRPLDAFPRQAALDVGVFGYVELIIVIDEVVVDGGKKSSEHQQDQDEAGHEGTLKVEEARRPSLIAATGRPGSWERIHAAGCFTHRRWAVIVRAFDIEQGPGLRRCNLFAGCSEIEAKILRTKFDTRILLDGRGRE